MRQAGKISDEQQARRFADYLLTQGIATKLDRANGEWIVWIRDETHVDRGRDELEKFLTNPDDPRFRDSAGEAEQIRREQARLQKQHAKNMVDMRRRWHGMVLHSTPVTVVFLALMVLATLMSDFGQNRTISDWLFINAGELVNLRTGDIVEFFPQIWEGQVWRLVTPIFMHGGLIHLIFNGYMFYQFGRLVELRRGSLRFLLLILVIAVVSNLAEYWLADFKDWPNGMIQPNRNFLGMSGVICGLFGFAWMRGKHDPMSGMRLHPQTVFILMLWLIICLFGFMRIANVAHFSGLAVGMFLGWAPVAWRRGMR